MIVEVEISSLKFETIIGILDSERENLQKISIDVVIVYEYSSSFLDYAKIREELILLFKKREFYLLEEALKESISFLTNRYKDIKKGSIKISKLEIFDDSIVSVKGFF